MEQEGTALITTEKADLVPQDWNANTLSGPAHMNTVAEGRQGNTWGAVQGCFLSECVCVCVCVCAPYSDFRIGLMSDVTADSTPDYLCCLENVSKTKMLAGTITFFIWYEGRYLSCAWVHFFAPTPIISNQNQNL